MLFRSRQDVAQTQNQLATASSDLAQAENALQAEEDTIAAALRALADQREGTARQEGHIKSLAARLDAITEEISRLTSARDQAQNRLDSAKSDYAQYELEIANADTGEKGLDALFESAKNALESAKKSHADLVEAERIADRERNAVEAKLEALTLTADAHDGAQALLNNSHGISIKGSIASLIEIEKGWESAVSAALGNLADAIVVSDVDSAIKIGRAHV